MLKRSAFGRSVVGGLAAPRLMKQARRIVMENTMERDSSWGDPLPVGAGQMMEHWEAREGARMAAGFETLLACEDDTKPPTARYYVATSANEEEV